MAMVMVDDGGIGSVCCCDDEKDVEHVAVSLVVVCYYVFFSNVA